MSESGGELVTTINGKDIGLATLLRTLESLGKQVDSSLTAAGNRIGQAIGAGASKATPALNAMGVSAERASRDALSLAQTYARGQASAGDYQGAIQRLTSAMEAQSVVNVRQAAQIQNQIAQYERAAIAAREKAAAETQSGGAMSALTGIAGNLGVALALPAAAAGAAALARQGATADLVARRFDALAQQSGTTGAALLGALRAASGGEISDLNLQLAANRAQLLGVADSAQELGVLMAIARDRAQQLGTDSATAFDDLVTGLGRGSPLILDNLGITVKLGEANEAYAASIGKTVSQLTEAQKKTALIQAVLKDGQASLAATGGAFESTAGGIDRFIATIDNLKNKGGAGLAEAFDGPLTGISRAIGILSGDVTTLTEMNQLLAQSTVLNKLFGQSFESAGRDAEIQAAGIAAFNQALAEGKNVLEAGAAAAEAMGQANVRSAVAARDAAAAAEEADAPTARLGKSLEAVAAVGPLSATGMFSAAGGMDAVKISATDAANATAVLLGLLGGVNDQRGSIGGTNAAASRGVTGFLGRAGQAAGTQARTGQILADVRANAAPERPRGGGSRISAAEKEQAALLKGQETYQNKSLDAEREYQDDLTKIAEDAAKARLEAQDKYDLDRKRSAVDFYKSLASFENQDLAKELSSKYEAAAAQAQEIAKTKGADAAQAYLQAQRDAIQSQGDLQNEIDKADKEGDKGKAEYYRGLLKLQQDADAEQLRQIEAQGSQVAASENAQYAAAEQRYAEHLEKMGLAYERKFGNAPPGVAPPPPATSGAGATTGSTPSGPASPGAAGTASTGAGNAQLVSDPGTQAAVDANGARLEAKLDALATAVSAVEKQTGDVARAVRELKSRGVTGGGG